MPGKPYKPLKPGTAPFETIKLQQNTGLIVQSISNFVGQSIKQEREFGFFMPFEAMTYWIRGKPEPSEEYRMISSNSEGALVSFEQFGWRVFIDYFFDNQKQNSPKRVKASFGENKVIVTVDS